MASQPTLRLNVPPPEIRIPSKRYFWNMIFLFPFGGPGNQWPCGVSGDHPSTGSVSYGWIIQMMLTCIPPMDRIVCNYIYIYIRVCVNFLAIEGSWAWVSKGPCIRCTVPSGRKKPTDDFRTSSFYVFSHISLMCSRWCQAILQFRLNTC